MHALEKLLLGRTLGDRYRIESVLGRGGMGVVYRAVDLRLERPVAVKVVGVHDDASRGRFRREARAVARLRHPNVVPVYDYGTDEALDLDYLVMELLEGRDLGSALEAGDRFGPEAAARILREAAEGVAAGHRAGLVHRDVKPANLFLSEEETPGRPRVRVLDFGIAQPTGDDATVTRYTVAASPLTPAYASPEQRRGDAVLTPATDVYSLGVVGYRLLSGDRPPTDPDQLLSAVEALDLPDPLRDVLRHALAFSPDERLPDAGAMARLLSGERPGEDEDHTLLVAPPPPAPPRETSPPSLRTAPPAGPPSATPPVTGAPEPVRPAREARRSLPVGTILAVVLALAAIAFVATQVDWSRLSGAFGSAAPPAAAVEEAEEEPEPPPPPPPEPNFEVVHSEADARCDNVFDRCATVYCEVANTGDASGRVWVQAYLRPAGAEEATRVRPTFLEPGTRERFDFDFKEYQGGKDHDFGCRALTSAPEG